jgi:alpha-tubulin suppressor-like RCC1 family protein
MVAAGGGVCGLDADSLAFCWGIPGGAVYPLAGGLHLATIAMGGTHGCGIDGSGIVYCWGQNYAGQLGDGTLNDRGSPAPVQSAIQPLPAFARVSAHANSSCAIDTSGRAWCWGNNSDGQLGRGFPPQPGDYYAFPVLVVGGVTWQMLTDGSGGHVCGLSVSGEAYCWGANRFGQVGVGTRDPVTAPTLVLP